jgi:hypothetical protein
MLASQGLPSLEERLTKLSLNLGYDMLVSQGLHSLEEGLTKLCLGLGYGMSASQGFLILSIMLSAPLQGKVTLD